jgi:hypothetical protein
VRFSPTHDGQRSVQASSMQYHLAFSGRLDNCAFTCGSRGYKGLLRPKCVTRCAMYGMEAPLPMGASRAQFKGWKALKRNSEKQQPRRLWLIQYSFVDDEMTHQLLKKRCLKCFLLH